MADEFGRQEVSSIYDDEEDRWIVSLVVGYEPERDKVETIEQAAKAALELTRDGGQEGTYWYVYDRDTGRGKFFEQSEFDRPDVVVK